MHLPVTTAKKAMPVSPRNHFIEDIDEKVRSGGLGKKESRT
jgi:hypothetical protein